MKDEDIKIGLYGIAGVYNYGCEAIIRGTEKILREIWPDINIKYASLRPEDDKNRLKGCNIEIVPRSYSSSCMDRLNGLLTHHTGHYFKKFYREDLKWLKDCNAILSIGGDLYTFPPTIPDSKVYYNPLIHFGETVLSMKKKFIVWGASIGPFEDFPQAKKAFINHLSHVDLITSREPQSTNYLKKQGIYKNVINCVDPAFSVPTAHKIKEKELNPEKIHIGINLSPLSSNYSFRLEQKDQIIAKNVELIESIIKNFNAHITLIPHVFCDFDINDDDFRYLKMIKSKISEELDGNVDLVKEDLGFINLKGVLATCDIVIASRMHCAINSISCGVPTIFLAYSQKALGMSEYIYGSNEWVIPLESINNSILLNSLNAMIKKNKELKISLEKRIEEINKQNSLLEAQLKQCFELY